MPKQPVKQKTSGLGNKFAKPDLERIGLFSEMPWMHGIRYKFPDPGYMKGLSMLPGGAKIKTAKQDCYFDKEFKRIFNGEAIKGRGKKPQESPFKNISTSPFMPTGPSKKHSSPGDYYGTFGGKIDSFGDRIRKPPASKSEGINFLSNPVKQGGPGYANICINPYPAHSVEKYGLKPNYKEYGKVLDGAMVTSHYPSAYFEKNPYADPTTGPTYVRPKEGKKYSGFFVPTGPAKLQGGCHAGCFEKFPTFISNRQTKPPKPPKPFLSGPFCPHSTADKTYYTTSVINENIRFRLNKRSQEDFKPSFINHLVEVVK